MLLGKGKSKPAEEVIKLCLLQVVSELPSPYDFLIKKFGKIEESRLLTKTNFYCIINVMKGRALSYGEMPERGRQISP